MVQNLLKRHKLLVTISNIQLSSDLKYAQIYIYFTGQDHTQIIKTLNSEVINLKRSLSGTLKTRFIPDLVFCYDNVLEKQLHINQLISESAYDES